VQHPLRSHLLPGGKSVCSIVGDVWLWAVGEADEVRLRELCQELLGPSYVGSSSETSHGEQEPLTTQRGGSAAEWLPHVLGLDKRRLLREEVLRDMGRNRSNQRLVSEFAQLLDVVENQHQ
jgi:protein HIRA/HIR1